METASVDIRKITLHERIATSLASMTAHVNKTVRLIKEGVHVHFQITFALL
jgi:hypothetical protein